MRTLNLSDKPSEFLTEALQDLQKVSNKRNVQVEMGSWCVGDGKVCRVCIAGATIMCRDDADFTSTIRDGLQITPMDYDARTQSKLYAINGFRLGLVAETLKEYRLASSEEIKKYVDLYGERHERVEYDHSKPLPFCEYIHNIILNLRNIGL